MEWQRAVEAGEIPQEEIEMAERERQAQENAERIQREERRKERRKYKRDWARQRREKDRIEKA